MPAEPFPCEPDQILDRVARASDLLVPDADTIVDGNFEEPEPVSDRLDLSFLGARHAVVDEIQSREDRPPESPHPGLAVMNPGAFQEPAVGAQNHLPEPVHAAHFLSSLL